MGDCMALKNYHLIWLESRPHRTRDWLQERLRDGFDMHHVDGDHSNDDPSNLVLIECSDHMRLHNRQGALGRLAETVSERRAVENAGRGALAYEALAAGAGWREALRATGRCGGTTYKLARLHASENGLPWPVPQPR